MHWISGNVIIVKCFSASAVVTRGYLLLEYLCRKNHKAMQNILSVGSSCYPRLSTGCCAM